MKVFIGDGQGNTKAALDNATKGLVAPSAIIFYARYDQLKEAAEYIYNKYPDAQSMGTIGVKFVKGVVGNNNISVLAFFDDAKVGSGVIQNLDKCPVADVDNIKDNIKKVSPGTSNTVCLEFCTNDEEKLVTTFNAAFGSSDIGLVGGTAYEDGNAKNAVAYNGKVYENSCVYMIIKNTAGKIKVFKENIYQKKEGSKQHIVTKADIKRKALIELDNMPAAAVYSRELNVPQNKIIENVFKNPMGRVVGDKVFISSMKSIDKDGAIVNFKRINKNDCIYFLELGDYREAGRETREAVKQVISKPSLVFSIDCVYRYILYQNENYIKDYVNSMNGLGAQYGLVCGGEQFNNQHVNQTMLCAIFE